MIKRVLVPLDKTETAEEILPLIAMLAKADASVRAVHVAPMPETVMTLDGRTIAYSDQEQASLHASWSDYVHVLTARSGLEVEDTIRFGDPATEILAEADAWGADTIALSTTTSCTLKRAILGGVAETILRRAPIAVLLYRPAAVAPAR
jgi:nucleotide-binding universal stress UspA family protein